MSFETMKVSDLKEVAETFGVDIEGAKNKEEIIASLAEEGVTLKMYEDLVASAVPVTELDGAEQHEANPVSLDEAKERNFMLVKMERQNFSYETHGFKFTKEHPFVAMSEEDADSIFNLEEGFRPATPGEAREYYS